MGLLPWIHRQGSLVRTGRRGSVPAWSSFADGGGNVGDPACKDVIVREYWLEDTPHGCGRDLGGIAVEMRDGAIINAWAYPSGDFDNSSFFYVRHSDGTQPAMHGWDDHAMIRVDPAECGEQASFTVPVRDER